MSKVILKEWKGFKIPFLFDQTTTETEILTSQNDQIFINYDIIASSFFFLSNWQEYVSEKKDKYNRFTYEHSIQNKLNIVDKPIVNYYFDILKTAIELGYQLELKNKLWGKHTFATCITHDIDNCKSAWIQGSYREIRNGNLLAPISLISKRIFSKDEWFNFDKIIDIENKFSAHSSFYFLSRNHAKNGIKNADYNIENPEFQDVFNLILSNSSESGIHGSIGTHNNSEKLIADIKRLRREITGGRFHFLIYDVYDTPEVLDKLNIRYDSSLGFAERYGFRNGFCLPFYIYDIKNDRSTNVLEIPLILMDCTLSRYMQVSGEVAMEKVMGIVQEIEKFNGCFTLLWHNTYFSDYKYKGWRQIFEKILEYCQQRNSLLTNGETIDHCFRSSAN